MASDAGKLRCTKEPYIEDIGPQRIKALQFSALSGEEIKKTAEVQVWTDRIYDIDRRPVENGLIDTRMGPACKSLKCTTCHGEYEDCPGHFGYYKLRLPVYNIGYFNNILNILKCICKACARIILPDSERKEFLKKMRNPKLDVSKKNEIMKKVRDRCKGPFCFRCGHPNGSVKKAKASVIIVEDFNETKGDEYRSSLSHLKEKPSIQPKHYFTPVKVLALFKKMTDEDCELLNLCVRPEKLIVTDIAIPPAPIRPSVVVDAGMSNEDGLTSILKNIIMTNSQLQEDLDGAVPAYKCLEAWALLQALVVEFINSESPAIPEPKHRGLVQRLKGKQGRFRGNLNGKRVNFTGRTVISPDPNLKISEVAVPIFMAQKLTYPERVSRHNIEKLRQCVRNGPFKYPGANYVILPDGTRDLKYGEKKNVANELKYGCVVERHLEDGDIVLFNRQPSLHRMSIMSHRARIMPWKTLRFNESVCNPYNADFDGDEMNMHVPQTEEARAEAFMLMGVQNNLCTPKNGEILVASTQDFLTSSFLITRKDTFYDRASFSLMCSYIGDGMDSIDLPTPALLKPIELWTGKQLFSVLIRPNANTKVFLNMCLDERIHGDCLKEIKRFNEKLEKDQSIKEDDKKYKKDPETMCDCDGHVYFRNSELISGQLGKVTLGNGNKNGIFSVLLRDYNPEVAARCMNRLAKLSARWIGNHGFSIGINDVQPGDSLNDKKKKTINDAYDKCSSFMKKFQDRKLTLKPGANAAETLELELTAVLNGIRGKAGDVCKKELHWRNSPLIMFWCGSKGSVDNISQMITCVGQQSVGGKRARNGFMDRTLPHFPIRSSTDSTPSSKGFVANSFFTGMTATEFFFHTMAGREGLTDTAVKTADTGYMSRRLMKGLEDLSLFYDQSVRTASGDVIQFVYGDDGMDPAKMEGNNSIPLNLDQLYMKVLSTCPCKPNESLSPSKIEEFVDERFKKYDMSTESGVSAAFKGLLEKFLRSRFKVLHETRRHFKLPESGQMEGSSMMENVAANISGISSKQLQVFLETCISRYQKKKLEAGAAIGAIGAQSIGEPGTQMTLKTFHFAGIASMNITLGVPRIKEIINAAKNISTPIIKATLLSNDKELSARIVKAEIEKTFLSEIAEVKTVMKSGQPYISIVLDRKRMKMLNIESFDSIKRSILNHPKIKLKPEHISIRNNGNLRIAPPMLQRNRLRFDLHNLESILPKVIVKGISTIGRAVFHPVKENSAKEEIYDLAVEGTNLLAVMGTPGVDASKTESNHVMEIKQTLGIEAARNSIINEIHYAMKEMRIDIRHMMLLADIMTYKGDVLGITRFGISKMKESVLMLASFEKTQEHLFDASFNGRADQIQGVSECIIMGIPMELGTGILRVRQRVDELPAFKYGPDPILC